MTKEEIADRCYRENKHTYITWKVVYKAMDEYSQQQCISFANFIAQHNYNPHDIDTWDEGRKNTHEVYDDFIEFQRIEQQNKP